MQVFEHPSPNFGPRKAGLKPRLVVLHYTAMETAKAALRRLSDPAKEVSAHFLIAEDGRLFRLVPEEARAWHAGAGCWAACRDVNSASIGIELANAASDRALPPFPEPQMETLTRLLRDLLRRYDLPPQAVIGHSDLAPERKEDPGPKFDWRRLARAGVSVWPGAVDPMGPRPTWAGFNGAAKRFGYDAPGQAAWPQGLAAFRLRFRPWAEGPPSWADIAALKDLARHHPPLDPTGSTA